MARPATLAKNAANAALRPLGLQLTRIASAQDGFGADAWSDIRTLLGSVSRPTVFDVGANRGKTVSLFADLLPGCEIHAFEPSPATFSVLAESAAHLPGVHLVNAAVGSARGTRMLVENEFPEMSSFLRPTPEAWGKAVRETPVEVVTLDGYCDANHVALIDLLKTDTQGFELEVLKGAESLLRASRVRLVFTEVIASDMYEGLPPFDEILGFLLRRGLRLAGLYNVNFSRRRVSFFNALFARDDLAGEQVEPNR